MGLSLKRGWNESFGYVGHLAKKSADIVGGVDWDKIPGDVLRGGPAYSAGTEAGKIAGSKPSREALGKTFHGLGWAEKNLNIPAIGKFLSANPAAAVAGGAFILAPSFWLRFRWVRYAVLALLLAFVAPIYFPTLRQSSPFYKHSSLTCEQPIGGLSGVVQAAGAAWGTAASTQGLTRTQVEAWMNTRADDAGVLWRQFLESLRSHHIQQAPLTPAQSVSSTGCCGAPGGIAGPRTASASLTAPQAPSDGALPAVAGFTAEQVDLAHTVIGAGQQRGLSGRGLSVGVMTALGESGLRNLLGGGPADNGPVGLFQQLGNGSWGTYADRTDPATAAGNFFGQLIATPGWESMTPTAAAHAVQRNANPDFYTPFWADAVRLVTALAGAPSDVVPGAQPAPSPTCTSGTLPAGLPTGGGSAQVEAMISFAMQQVGKPYLWGAAPMASPTGPVPASYDCSSLVDSAWLAAGVDLPGRQTTFTLVNVGSPVGSLADVQRGDIILPSAGHVGIALGGGMMVDAPHTGAFVRVEPIWGFFAARRMTAGSPA